MIRVIEEQLGRELSVSQRQSVPTLNHVTSEMIAELRRLPRDAVNTYLKFHLREGSESFFEDFARDVIYGDTAAQTWGFQDVLALVRERDRGTALTMSADGLRATFAEVEGERWTRYAVDDARQVNRSAGSSSWGAPGILVRHAPYFWKPPRTDVMTHVVSSRPTSTVSNADLAVAVRRWIAFRVAWWTKATPIDLPTAHAPQVADALGIAMSRVSADGVIALTALRREAQSPFDRDKQVHGYVGPDEWFSG